MGRGQTGHCSVSAVKRTKKEFIPDSFPGGACRRAFTFIRCSYTAVDLIYVKRLVIIWRLILFFWFLKIIHKIKLQKSDVNMTPSQICDRIFELVDKNNDGGF